METAFALSLAALIFLGITFFARIRIFGSETAEAEARQIQVLEMCRDIVTILALSFMLSVFFSHISCGNSESGGKWRIDNHPELCVKNVAPIKKVEKE